VAAPGTTRDLLRLRLGVPTSGRPSLAAATTSGIQVIRQDPARVSFILVNTGGNAAFVGPDLPTRPTGLDGIRIDPFGGALLVEWETDGEMVGWAWRGVSIGGPTTFYLLENVIDQGRTPRAGGPAASP